MLLRLLRRPVILLRFGLLLRLLFLRFSMPALLPRNCFPAIYAEQFVTR